jgi:tryptophan synthase alpha subunit
MTPSPNPLPQGGEGYKMNRLAAAFGKGRPALVCFVTAGDPTPDATRRISAA